MKKKLIFPLKLKKKSVFLVFLLFFALYVLSFIPSFFKIKQIKITGNDYIKEESILESLPKNLSFWHLQKTKLLELINKNPFIEKSSIKIEYFSTMIIDITPFSLVGKITLLTKEGYLNEKGQFLTSLFSLKEVFLPQIKLSTQDLEKNIIFLCEQLAIFKYNNPGFFKRIKEIDLLGSRNVSIFIVNDNFSNELKEYRLTKLPSIQDFIKIQILEEKHNKGSVVILNGDSVIIKN